jgi:hypothetical protein
MAKALEVFERTRFAFIPILTKKEDTKDDLDDSFKVVTASLTIRDILSLIAKANLDISIRKLSSRLISLDGNTNIRIALDYMLNNGIRNIGIRQEGSAHDDVVNKNTRIKSNLPGRY